jgi:hypothetical protein
MREEVMHTLFWWVNHLESGIWRIILKIILENRQRNGLNRFPVTFPGTHLAV